MPLIVHISTQQALYLLKFFDIILDSFDFVVTISGGCNMTQHISKQDSKISPDSEKPIVSFACGKTYALINETHIHAHPVSNYYPQNVYPYLMARAKGGISEYLYKVVDHLELNPMDKAKVNALPAKYISVKKYIAKRMPKMGFKKAPTPYRFYLLEPIYIFDPIFTIIKNDEHPKYYNFEDLGIPDLNNEIRIPDNEEEQYKQAATLSIEQLKAIAEKHEINSPEKCEITTYKYKRDPYIAEFAKRQANGICQLCKMQAPFNTSDGKPYLETHHIKWLSEGGSDTIDNTVAVCPNCHKKLHILNDDKDVAILKSLKQGNN